MAHAFDLVHIFADTLHLVFRKQTAQTEQVIPEVVPEAPELRIHGIDFPVMLDLIFQLLGKQPGDLFVLRK